MNPRVRITDVAPRDGLQNEPNPIPSADKVRLVDALSRAGVDEVEVSSFVSPKWVPQLGDADEVFAGLTPRAGVVYSALVPNERGLASAMEVRSATRARHGRALPDKLAVFNAASQTFAQRNTNATIEQTIERFAPIASACRAEGIPLRGYVSCVIACPFEGPIAPDAVARVVDMLLGLGARAGIEVEIDLGDTIGAGTPESVSALLERVMPMIPAREADDPRGPALTLHLHDTFGRAVACVERALALGVRSFDASAGGLGGCPFASRPGQRAPGNVDTMAVVGAIRKAGMVSGLQHPLDLGELESASALAVSVVQQAGPQR